MMLAHCIEFAALPLRSAERLCLSRGSDDWITEAMPLREAQPREIERRHAR